jgi:hypothetical protein
MSSLVPMQLYIFLVLLLLIVRSSTVHAQNTPGERLDAAIASLKHIEPNKLSETQKEASAKEIDKAWEVIRASGKSGVLRLKQQIEQLNNTNQRDDFFKLNASALLWQIGRIDEVEAIAAIWGSTPLNAQYNYVFYTAFEAGMTQDARVLPMLEACLTDNQGKVFIQLHSLDVQWPLTIEFLWGAFGSKGLPVLAKLLEDGKDPVKAQSAMVLLTQAHYQSALPAIRRLARSSDQAVRKVAIRCLGIYGHPQDYDFLVAGLGSKDAEDLFTFVYALYEYEDLRAVPPLIPLLKVENEFARREVVSALMHLSSVASIDALQEHCKKASSPQEREECTHAKETLDAAGLDLERYKTLSTEQKKRVTNAMITRSEEDYSLRPGEKLVSHEGFLERARIWREKHRLTCEGDQQSCTDWTVLGAATVSDLEMLFDVRASLYTRLSDECLYEVRTINELIKRLGRSRYRRVVGLSERVEAR